MGTRRVLMAILAILLAASACTRGEREPRPTADVGTAVQRSPSGDTFAPGERPKAKHDAKHVLVRFEPNTTSEEKAEAHRKNGERVDGRLSDIDVDVVRVKANQTPEQAAQRYQADPNVVFAEPNFVYSIHAAPNDTFYPGGAGSPSLWGLHNTGQSGGKSDADIDAPEGWDVAGVATGAPWPVARYAVGIVDTGIDAAHPDLSGRVITPCYKALAGTGSLSTGCPDDNGHGTHVAGTVAAIGNDGRGVVGVSPNASVHACKALDGAGSGWMSDIAACVNRLVDDRNSYGIKVISMSLGGPSASTMQLAVDRARDNGVLVVAAAGNDGNATVHFPAGYASVVSVAATDRLDARASFSNSNDDVEIAAPGVTIMSTTPNNSYGAWSGTSMATPHVAGVAALVAWRTGSAGQALRDRLTTTADDLGTTGRDPGYGFGRVNLCRALGGCGADPLPTASPMPSVWTTVSDGAATYRGTWSRLKTSKANGGSYRRSSSKSSRGTYTFTGRGVRWIGLRTPRAGITEVRVDGVKVAEVDAYSPTTRWKQVLFERTGLSSGTHRLELIVTGRKNASSASRYTYVDGFARS